MTHIKTTKKAIWIFTTLTLLAFIFQTLDIPLNVSSILSATSIFYSILLGFFIAAAMANLSRLKSLVAQETGGLISLYNLVRVAAPEKITDVRGKIDTYIIKRFDYEISDYNEHTSKEYFAIFDVLGEVNPQETGKQAALGYISAAQFYISQSRREISIVAARIVSQSSWIVLNILSIVIVLMLFLMRDGTLASSIVTSVLSSSALIALLTLNDIDGNRFGEEEFAIKTYQAVFKALELDTYYPEHFLVSDRHIPHEIQYRTGHSNSVKLIKKTT
jgi:hypothetical protein